MQALVNVVIDVCPKAVHKRCARYIFTNWSKRHRGGEMKRQFWKATWSTFEEEFADNMIQLGDVSSNATKDLMNHPPHIWVKAYFSGRWKSWVVVNNMVESFNAWVLEDRHMLIKTMLEFVRKKTMNR